MAEEVGSLRVGLSLDSAKFEHSMASVDRNLKALGQEMAIVRAKGSEWGSSTEGLTTKQKTLSTMLESQDVKVKKLNESYQKAVTEQGANSKAAENLAIKLNKASAEYTKTETELGQVTSALDKQQAELNDTSKKWDDLAASTARTGEKLQATGEKMKTVGRGLSTAVTLPILGIGVASVKTALEFESGMDRVGAIAGATKKEMKALSDTALELGASTSKSASEVAAGMENMAAMGFNANEIMAAMPGIISAAEASGADMALTADVVAAALNGFGLEAKEANRVSDILAQTANQSAADITDMQYALKYAAPIANSLGVSLEELSASIGIMSDAGIEGSQAGTTLRGGLIALLKPAEKTSKTMEALGISVEDANGEFIGLSPLIKNISESLEGQTEVQKLATLASIVGTEAASGFLVLMEAGPEKIDKMTKSLENSGGASAETAAKMKDNLKGTLEELGGAFETAAITIGTALTPAIKDVALQVQDWVEKFQALEPEAQKNVLAMAGLAAAIGPVVLVGGHLATSIGSIAKLASPLIGIIGKTGLGGSFLALANPIGLTVAGLGLLTVAVGVGVKAYKESNDVNIEVLEAKQKEIDKNDKLIETYGALREKNQLSNEEMLRFLDIQAQLDKTNAPEKVKALKDEQALLLEKSTLTNGEMDKFLGLNQKVIDTAPGTVKAISSEGEAFALNTIALKELNVEKAKELENAARETLKNALNQEKDILKEQAKLLEEINAANEQQRVKLDETSTISAEIREYERNILDLQKQKNGASIEQIVKLDEKIRREKELKASASEQLLVAEARVNSLGNEIDKKEESLGKSRKDIALAEEARFKYEEIILAQAGITSEKGRGLEKVNEEIGKLETQKGKLGELLSTGKINTAEYQEQNEKIGTQISRLQDAQSELRRINDTAGKTVYKDVKINESPANFWDTLDEKLRRPITKTVNIRYNNMNGPQDPGGFAVGTKYAPGGMAWVGEEGPELMYVPNGSRIIPNDDSQRLMNKWNIPSSGATQSTASTTTNAPIVHNTYHVSLPNIRKMRELENLFDDRTMNAYGMNG